MSKMESLKGGSKMRGFAAVLLIMIGVGLFQGCSPARTNRSSHLIRQNFVFVDMHAHPGRFHRADVDRISREEIFLYRKQKIDLVVCSVSSDAIYRGGYVSSVGRRVKRLKKGKSYPLRPGEAFDFSLERFNRIQKTAEDGDAILALEPAAVLKAREQHRLALLPALEGGDGLEGNIENLGKLYRKGLRLLQFIHFRNNEIGYKQTKPYRSQGLTPFGKSVVKECNRLGIIIDLAHANTRTTLDVLAVSEHPVVVSHTGAKAIYKGDRYLDDREIKAIAAKGGIIGIWPNGNGVPLMEDMMQHIDHVRKLVGVSHIGIGSDLRGMKKYTAEFGDQANFEAIVAALIDRGYSDNEVGLIMGGNFFSLWQTISRGKQDMLSKSRRPG